MITWLLSKVGVEYDELDLTTDPRWRAQVVLLNHANDAERRAERLVEQAFVQLESVAVHAAGPQRRRKTVVATPYQQVINIRRTGT